MSINIHKEAEKAFNKSAFELIELIEEKDTEPQVQKKPIGSSAQKPVVDWSDKLVDAPFTCYGTDYLENHTSIFQEYKGKKTGYNESNYIKFSALVKSVYKLKDISQKTSYKFVYDITFKWLIETYKNKQATSDYISHLISQINLVISDYKYDFTVLNLDIEKNFRIGNVEFICFNPKVFNELGKNKPEEAKLMIEKFQGKVYASYSLKDVEKSRGEEIALAECYKAMNVLKTFSPTVMIPTKPTTFDIDRRINIGESSESIVKSLKDEKDLTINFQNGAMPFQLSVKLIDELIEASRNFAILISTPDPNELQKLIINSLSKFSEAISDSNIHKRIVNLFTIWESLLLKDSDSPIISSVSLNGSILLKNHIEERKKFIAFLKEMYKIRSEVVHHAKERELEMKNVSLLQLETINLMNIITYHSGHTQQKILF